jgi:cell division GTPase FtsZ
MKRREFLQSASALGAASLFGLPDPARAAAAAPQLPDGVVILGTGGAGGKVVRHLIEHGLHPTRFAALDADAADLAESRAGLQILMGSMGQDYSWITTQDQAIAAEDAICPLLKTARKSLLVAGLGGCMGQVYAHVIACLSQRASREAGRQIDLQLVVGMPFR